MVPRLAPGGRSHRDAFGAWHFEAVGALTRMAPAPEAAGREEGGCDD
jgi:hypothetical protein